MALALGFNVIAIDPRVSVIGELSKRHAGAIEAGKLTVLHAALNDKAGVHAFFHANDATSLDYAAASARHGKYLEKGVHMKENVVTITLDALIGEGTPSAVIKLDIQGYEHEALLGATALLARPPKLAPMIIFEILETLRPDLMNLVTVQQLRTFGYNCYDITSKVSNRLSDGSMKHMHRCCASFGNKTCKEWVDQHKESCNTALYTDLVCTKS